MSVLIRGMEMPTSCFECRFSIDGFCYASGHVNIKANEERQITNYCPLIPVPPHGRLIDESEIPWCVDWYAGRKRYYTTPKTIEHLPTIIPADPAEEVE